MMYGIDRTRPNPPHGCLRIGAAACRFDVSVEQLKAYSREGLLIPLQTSCGVHYYTDDDYLWISTIGHLLHEAHLSFGDIRQLLAQRSCWQIRHCDFHTKGLCPLITDSSKPCWINRARCAVLCSYPCYSCTAYRSVPDWEVIRAFLSTPACDVSPANGYYGG
jgi:hypothetical protein